MKRRFGTVILLVIFTIEAGAQNMIGRVVDSKTKEALIGAVVSVDSTSAKVLTDANGAFSITGVKPGEYHVTVTYLSYKAAHIGGVQSKDKVSPNDEVVIPMERDERLLQGVRVRGVMKKNTEVAMIATAKNSSLIVSNVSAQEIQRTQDTNAEEVIRRVPGISIIDEKFVMVRGLSQRYNNVWINGGAVPSSEADSRAFSFDIIPSSQIDNLQITKTPSPEYPADYSGGFIEINTKEIPTVNSMEVSVGGNFNDRTSFGSFDYSKGSGTDFLGFDGGKRSLDGGISGTMKGVDGVVTNDRTKVPTNLIGNGLNNDWKVKNKTPLGDGKLAASLGRRWHIGENLLGMIASLNYTSEYRKYDNMKNNLYSVYDAEKDKSVFQHEYVDNQYNHNVRLGMMLNFTFLSANGKNKYQWKNIFNQLGNDRYTWREGTNAQSENEKMAEYYYRSRTTYNTQLTGKHTFALDELQWNVGYAYANRHLPDRRRYTLTDSVIYNSNDLSREWTQLDEHIVSANVNDTRKFTFGNFMPKLKVGAYGEYKTRTYRTRNFIYNWDPTITTLPTGFRAMDPTELLSNSEYYGAVKLYLMELVQKRNDYDGHNTLGAGYVAATLPFGKLSVYTGVRFEHNKMELVSNTRDYETSHSSRYYKDNYFYPSVNSTYKVNEQHQVRFSYGRSINRPEFREVSSSVFYDFDLASDVQGNTELKNCLVDNVDLRYEFYPSQGEIISLAAFYKHFDNPIEWTYTITGGTDLVYSYLNARSANNYGLELDIRKDLSFIGLRNFSWAFNGSLIHSRVSFPSGSSENNRPMQGQSPYLVNTGVFYKNEVLKLNVSLLYNRIGKRIIGVGRNVGVSVSDQTARVPDSYEMPRDVLDFAASKQLGKHWEVKLNVRDLLAQKVNFKQFAEVNYADGSHRTVQQIIKQYKPGRNVGFMVVYKF